jgi:serine phosphatase RsbU (regulator of sigma subunit)
MLTRKKESGRYWRAVMNRDARYDGHFVFAVRSTGIYCRPSCPSRRPLRKHVLFYRHPRKAEQMGFRACRRCHPLLFEEAQERQRMAEELRLAAEIQTRLLPAAPPPLDGWELAVAWAPCREVGGDYFDFVTGRRDGRLAIAVGDVSGKGAGAALVMSSLHAAVRAQSRLGLRVPEIMASINGYLCESTSADKFVSLFYGELDLKTGALDYCNAGHLPPLVVRSTGGQQRLAVGGPVMGILPGAAYEQGRVRLEAGDALLLFSDGVTELQNGRGDLFGYERLSAVAEPGIPAAQLCERIQRAGQLFARGRAPSDDTALVVLRREPRAEVILPEVAECGAGMALHFV